MEEIDDEEAKAIGFYMLKMYLEMKKEEVKLIEDMILRYKS